MSEMKQLPEAETYEEGLEYWPYKKSLQTVLERAISQAPKHCQVLDAMCGPGYLLAKIKRYRPDLELYGVDLDDRYVLHAQIHYKDAATFYRGDILAPVIASPFPMVLCTGSIHHIHYDHQDIAVANIAKMTAEGGVAIISDCYVDDYDDEAERKLAAAKLGYEYLRETIKNGAPEKVVEWTVDILHNDVLMHEYKTSLRKRLPVLQKHFGSVETIQVWPPGPEKDGYGDYVHICSN
jgi:SAM-dependent methyltransferase